MNQPVGERIINVPGTVTPWQINVEGNSLLEGVCNFMIGADQVKNQMNLMTAVSKATLGQIQSNTNTLNALDNRVLPETHWPDTSTPSTDPKVLAERDAQAFAATEELEAQGANLAMMHNRYRVTTIVNGVPNYTYSDHVHIPRIINGDDPNLQEHAFVANPNPVQLLTMLGQVASPPLED
ncbi:MAG: hypothetical protein ACRYGK_18900, partial [Janthinobacterium lividum]